MKAELFVRMENGEKRNCPCCGQHVQMYSRRVFAPMARQLLRLYRNGPLRRPEIERNIVGGSRDWHKLRHWGLIEPTENLGEWSITAAGINFVEGHSTIPKIAMIYNGEPRSFSAEQVTFAECWGDNFSLDEVLSMPDDVQPVALT